MVRDELIALGLGKLRGAAAAAAATDTEPEPELEPDAPDDLLRAPLTKLLTLILDLVTKIEIREERALRARIESCRDAIAGTNDRTVIIGLVDDCAAFCRRLLGEIDRQRLEQKEEIANLVGMVREALAIVSGDGQSFNKHLDGSMQRFEALVQMDDLMQLKRKLVEEVGELRQIAAARQREWEDTARRFGSKVEALEKQLKATKLEASLDPLTHIANRGAFNRTFQEWLAKGKTDFVLGMIDIDNFKSINDTHGHPVGDRALVTVAHVLQTSVRKEDVVGRVGGDEFAVLIPEMPIRQAEARLRMLGASLAAVALKTHSGATLTITLSVGLAEYTAGDTIESLKERADIALYEAKRLGRNRVVSNSKPTLRDLLRR